MPPRTIVSFGVYGVEARDARAALLRDDVEDRAERAGRPVAVRRVVEVEDLVEQRLAHHVRGDVERAGEVVGDRPVVRVRGGRSRRRDGAHEAHRDRMPAIRLRVGRARGHGAAREARLPELAEERVEVLERARDPLEVLAILADGYGRLELDHPAVAAVHRVRHLDARDNLELDEQLMREPRRLRVALVALVVEAPDASVAGQARRTSRNDRRAARLLGEERGQELVERGSRLDLRARARVRFRLASAFALRVRLRVRVRPRIRIHLRAHTRARCVRSTRNPTEPDRDQRRADPLHAQRTCRCAASGSGAYSSSTIGSRVSTRTACPASSAMRTGGALPYPE